MKPAGFVLRRSVFYIVIAIVVACFGSLRPSSAQSPVPVEIVELARALKNNPDLIYEYVYNNIETLPQHGSLKGALGTLLDGKGTAFDQAELMVALLQQSGLTASYQIGEIQYTTDQLTNWLGIDTAVGSVDVTLGSGGFSGELICGSNPQCGPSDVVTAAKFGWAWVVVNIGGTNFVFDPSTKTYSRSTGIGKASIANALGYTQSGPTGFINRAETGATVTSSSIVGLNRANIRSDLTTFANSLVQYIRSTNPVAAPADIVGGKAIVQLPLGAQQRLTSLAYAVSGTVQNQPTIPSSFRTTLTLTLGSNDSSGTFTSLSSALTFNSSDIYGHRIVASFNSSVTPSLLFDGVTQLVGSGAVPAGRQMTIRVSISHPYGSPFENVTNSDQVRVTPQANLIYLIGTGWGQTGRGMIEKHRKLLQQNAAQSAANPTSEPVLGESLAMLSYTWLAELSQQQQLSDELAGTTTVYHHAVGVVGMKAVGASVGPFVDLPLNNLSITQRIGRPEPTGTFTSTPSESAVFFCDATFLSIAESGMLEQTQPGATATSTVKLIDNTVQSGGKIFDINNSAVAGDDCFFYDSTIRSQLQGTYSPADLARIDALVGRFSPGVCASPRLRVVAPMNGSITVNQYTGAGYFQVSQDGTAIGAIISGGLSGGLPASPVTEVEIVNNTPDSVFPALPQSSVITNPQGSQGDAGGVVGATQTSNEPINLVTGDYLNNSMDLTVGSQSMPYGLAFQRYYDSGTRSRKGPMGFGWTHNFAIVASTDSDAFAGLAANSPISGAAAIAATFVTLDILNDGTTNAKPLDRIVIGSVVQRWLMDQLITNIVSIAQPGYVEHFTKLADRSYNPPPGSATMLTFSGGTFKYLAKNQQALSFDTAGNLTTLINPAGTTITLNYTGSPEVVSSVTNNLGRALNFSYSSGLLTKVSDSGGRSVSYVYDAASNLIGFTDPLGKTTTYAYDIPGRLTKIFYPSSPGAARVTNTYDSLGRVKTQASGASPPWQYFLAGARSEEVDPFGTQHVIYTTPHGKTRTEIQDLQGLNLVTSNSFDPLDRLIGTTAPEGGTLSYTYDTRSNVLTTTATPKPGSPLAPLTTTYGYDPLYNKPTSITDPLGLITSMSYDGATGNLTTSVSDVGGSPHFNALTSFTYNGLGLLLTATDPLGVVSQYGYDAFGNRTSITRDAGDSNHLNRLSTIAYDAVGDAISVTDPKGNVSTSTYDVARRPLSTTTPGTSAAPGGVKTAFSYDADGRVIQTQQSIRDVVQRTTATTYTLTGKPATTTDANGGTSTFAYDVLDRLSSTIDPMQRATSIVYDALSRRSKVFNAAIQSAPLLQQTYTPDGLLASLTDANNHATSFAYDGFDRLGTTTYPLGSTEILTYDADGNPLTRKTRANQTIAFAYDTLNRLKTKTPPAPAAVVSYGYDLAGRLTTIGDTSAAVTAAVPPSGPSVQYTANYGYDALNRPTAVNWTPAPIAAAPSASRVTFGHAYNKANQRVGQTASDNSWFNYPAATPSTVSYTTNALNQYTAVGAASPSYDGNGNLTSDGIFTLGYDAENRLISASGAGNTASYTFDAQGRRKTKTVNGATTVFVTDAGNREVLEYDGASGAVQRWYAYGLGSNDVLNQINVVAAARATLVPDIQGSVIASLDSGAGVLSKIGYLPYGKSASAGPFGYTGQRIDPETSGLYYYRARHYSPAWGRFLQADPIGYGGGSNLYAYVGNDPLNLNDPNGFVAEGFGAGFKASFTGDDANLLNSILPYGSTTAKAASAAGFAAGFASNIAAEIGLYAVAEVAIGKLSRSVWDLGWATRGLTIEQQLGANLPAGYPVIDNFASGVATSIKSIDLNAATYQNIGSLTRTVNGYVDSVASFNGATRSGVAINASEITARQLQLAYPAGSMSAAQQAAIDAAATRAQGLGVNLITTGVR